MLGIEHIILTIKIYYNKILDLIININKYYCKYLKNKKINMNNNTHCHSPLPKEL